MSRSIAFPIVAAALCGSLSFAPASGCSSRGLGPGAPGGSSPVEEEPAATARRPPRPPALEIEDLNVGSGRTADADRIVVIHYTGWLNKAKFDSSRDRNPLEFRLGKGEVLRGWDQGIPGMKVGGKRRLTIPPELGYGARGSPGGAIPPNSVLVFEIELMDVKD